MILLYSIFYRSLKAYENTVDLPYPLRDIRLVYSKEFKKPCSTFAELQMAKNLILNLT